MHPNGPRHLIPATALAIALTGWGCGQGLLPRLDEGVIEYRMSFPDIDPKGLMADMLPEKAVLNFNHDQQALDVSAGMGIFRTCMVVNTSRQVVDYHMSVMGKSLVAEYRMRDLNAITKAQPTLAVVHTMARDTIAGLPCKQAYLIYVGLDQPEAEVWYTDELNLEKPNWYSPFSEIDGVLMRYEVVQHGIRMRMEATYVRRGAVDAKKFAVRPDHQRVAPDVLNQQLSEVLGTFSQ